jgi:TRAP-type mannitol/chloroaromatic compound transport system permease small subunit
MAQWLDSGIGRLITIIKWAALAVALLLFVQWPLREWIQAYSREANDIGQWLFALFVAASVTAATRSNRHIAADGLARGYSPGMRRGLQIFGIIFGVVPWALFVAWSGWPAVRNSVAQLERFQDTGNGGYFIVKVALLLLVVLMLAQAVCDLLHRGGKDQA